MIAAIGLVGIRSGAAEDVVTALSVSRIEATIASSPALNEVLPLRRLNEVRTWTGLDPIGACPSEDAIPAAPAH
jgi:hypothetical protein